MATAKKTDTGTKAGGKKPTGKKAAKRTEDVTGPATVWVDRWVTDPTTGKKVRLILHRLPGKGKIPRKAIREAVRKVRLERLAAEKAAAAGNSE
jgi:hypothetical protein